MRSHHNLLLAEKFVFLPRAKKSRKIQLITAEPKPLQISVVSLSWRQLVIWAYYGFLNQYYRNLFRRCRYILTLITFLIFSGRKHREFRNNLLSNNWENVPGCAMPESWDCSELWNLIIIFMHNNYCCFSSLSDLLKVKNVTFPLDIRHLEAILVPVSLVLNMQFDNSYFWIFRCVIEPLKWIVEL